ncbi:NUDIX hydrolase [Planctomicrobium sp. SH661]|uniref:NUDIX hydrolase n=1 Tax=Planctomicrobium sp. SH661 TaxID=3448124 RepID=UPI003F5B22EB
MTQPHREILAKGKYLTLVKEGHWEYVDRTRGIRAVAIIALTRNNELILTEQYRFPLKKQVIEVPAGLVGDEPGFEDELEELAAHRELVEETGYSVRKLKRIASGPTSPGMATETLSYYLGKGARKVGNGGGVDGEDIQVHVVPVSKVAAWLKRAERSGKLVDVKTHFAAAWLAAAQ